MNFRLSSLILLLHFQESLTLDSIPVTCGEQNICAPKGTEVILKCYYSNINITTGFWFSQKQKTNWRNRGEPEDLTLDSDYSGRVDQEITKNNSYLTIRDLIERDSGEYQLMIIMKDGVKHLSSVTVNLTVTGLSNSGCWGVTYTSTRVCALVGSTVDIHSSYSHPSEVTVEKTFWYSGKVLDLRDVHQFAGRVEYINNTLRIKDVNTSDSGKYGFRFITNKSYGFTGSLGVTLTVTDTQVISSPNPVIDGEKVILSCSTKCTLDSKHTYIWYKNGQQVTDGLRLLNKLYLDSINSEELQEYSCTVREEAINISVFGHHTVCLLVFLLQFLIFGSLWMWFFISMNKLKSKNRTDDKHEETQVVHMSVCRSAELLE